MSARTFKTEEDFKNQFQAYLDHCKEIEYLPNIAGFCRFMLIHRGTYYDQKLIYPDTFKLIDEFLEDEGINCKTIGDSFKKFYMANKFNWKDRQEVSNTNTERITIVNELPTEYNDND